MSTKILPAAYATKLGNLTAKSVLVLIADQANNDGLGWPGYESISDWTEVSLRTVRRMVQVMEVIGLVTRCEAVNQFGRKVDALQINVQLLGGDLAEAFAEAYQAVASKKTVAETAPETVAETAGTVAATEKTVAATVPPHPHKGGPFSDPLLTHPPVVPRAAGDVPLTDEQLAHLATLTRPEDRPMWERHYRECNAAEIAQREREAAARAEFATREAAIAAVMRGCRWQRGVRRNPVPELIGQVLDTELAAGAELWVTGPRLIAAWGAMRAAVQRGKSLDYGPAKFLRDGHWRDWA